MLKKFKNNQELSKALALYIVKNIKRKKSLILGCPGGRSLKNTYKYIGILTYKMNIDLSRVKILDDSMIKKEKSPIIIILTWNIFKVLSKKIKSINSSVKILKV